jgi:hypothetical protein
LSESEGDRPSERTRKIAWALGIAVIIWRICTVPAGSLWRDWLVLVTIAVMARVSRPGGRIASAATIAVAAFMLTTYARGQLPHLLETLGLWH